jgi:hypothetical protein
VSAGGRLLGRADEADRAGALGPAGARPALLRTVLVLGSSALLLLGGLLLAPPSPVELPSTSVFNVLFQNRWVVGATRLVGAMTLWFLLASMVARASQGQWVRRAGSVDVGDEVSAVSDDQEVLQRQLVGAYETIERLRHQLAEAVALLESMSETGDGGRRTPGVDDGGGRGDQ